MGQTHPLLREILRLSLDIGLTSSTQDQRREVWDSWLKAGEPVTEEPPNRAFFWTCGAHGHGGVLIPIGEACSICAETFKEKILAAERAEAKCRERIEELEATLTMSHGIKWRETFARIAELEAKLAGWEKKTPCPCCGMPCHMEYGKGYNAALEETAQDFLHIRLMGGWTEAEIAAKLRGKKR
jgi:polyhydroxyalkanoate synthesis regulator phasin